MIADDGAHSSELEPHLMARWPTHITFEFVERRNSAQFGMIKKWLFGPDPDPIYDRVNGWKLDQFAMHFFPDLVREYKKAGAEEHPSAGLRDGFAPRHPMKALELGHKLSDEIIRRLLNTQFRVDGYPLQSNELMAITSPLLENMHPSIETSELRETQVPGENARWFERVRVFDLAAATKQSGGRKPTYDWPRLVVLLEQERPVLTTKAELVEYCRKNVTVIRGKRAQKGGPDDNTIRAAISQYGLEKFINPA
jgi:hypothetical protein